MATRRPRTTTPPKPRLTPRQRVREAARELGLTNLGGGADWLSDTWHLGPSASPNRTSGDRYLLADEDDASRFHMVSRYHLSDDGTYHGAPAKLQAERPDLFDGYNDVVWFEREGLTAAEAVQLLQRHMGQADPLATAKRLKLPILPRLPRSLWGFDPGWRLGTLTSPSGFIVLTASKDASALQHGDLVLARIPAEGLPVAWSLYRIATQAGGYKGLSNDERKALKTPLHAGEDLALPRAVAASPRDAVALMEQLAARLKTSKGPLDEAALSRLLEEATLNRLQEEL